MKKNTSIILLYFFIDCSLLIISLSHLPSVVHRSTFPFSVQENNGSVIVENRSNDAVSALLAVGDTIVAVNDSTITIAEQLEFISDNTSIGATHTITILKYGSPRSLDVVTLPYYPTLLYVIVIVFIGISFWLVGFFVVWSRPRDTIAHLFHWMMVLVGMVIMITWGSLESKDLFTLILRSLFFFSYVIGIASFYLFTTLYCVPVPRYVVERIVATYSAAFLFCGILIYYHLKAISTQSLTIYAQFQGYFDLFHILIVVVFIAGIINIVRAYNRTNSTEERKRLEWIMWGFSISSTPFLVFYILPQIIFSRYIIPEEYTTIFFIALPFSFGVSSVKHQLFDIRMLIKRTIVNFIFSMIIAVGYFIIVILATAIINDAILSMEHFIIVALTLIIAMAFNPLRNKLTAFIDRLLFKARTEYSTIQSELSKRLQRTMSKEEIFTVVLETIHSSLPLEQCIVFRPENDQLIPTHPMIEEQTSAVPILIDSIRSILTYRAAAVPSIIRTDSKEDVLIDHTVRSTIGCELFVPIKNGQGTIVGAIGINRIRTHDRFDTEEISLLLMICDRAGEHLERMEMLETMFREKEERKRAEELNTLKSDFVSYVSHELQTPLTSIRMFSELLWKSVSTRKGKEQLEIITGESDRLSRMVNNLLDGSRIESGLKEYQFEQCTLNAIIESVVKKMNYLIKNHGCTLRYSSSPSLLTIVADKEAIEQAVMNLISNAIKYSREKKTITITVGKKNGYARCIVRDTGDGIAKKNIPFLFERFYRQPEHQHTIKGIGLGLSLVKHIIDAHRGKIEVHSTVGKGSTFTLFIPLQKESTSV